jgi:hypothetical protein
MSFLELSDELLLRIFTLSKGPAPFNTQDICSIILTCRRFYRVALHDVLYREIEFWRGDAARFTRFLHTITVHPEHASSVRDAVFTWSRGDAKAWELAFDIIPRLSSMHTLALQVENDDDYDPDSDSVVIIDINDPDAPEPERRLSFSDFLLQCVHLPIRTLCVADDKISTEDIENFSAIRALEHLRIFYFDSNVSDMTGLVVPSNAPPSTIIKLEFRLSMLPPTAIAGSVPSMLKHYPHLQDLIWEFTDDCIDFCPTDFIRALLPIKATLVKLSLLLDTRTTMEKHRLDLSQLTALKVLRVHERLIFDVNHQNTEWAMSSLEKQVVKHDPLGLSQRLPATLEQLEVSSAPHDYHRFIFTVSLILSRSYLTMLHVSLHSFARGKRTRNGSLLWHTTRTHISSVYQQSQSLKTVICPGQDGSPQTLHSRNICALQWSGNIPKKRDWPIKMLESIWLYLFSDKGRRDCYCSVQGIFS